jgi:hypothetical protein
MSKEQSVPKEIMIGTSYPQERYIHESEVGILRKNMKTAIIIGVITALYIAYGVSVGCGNGLGW